MCSVMSSDRSLACMTACCSFIHITLQHGMMATEKPVTLLTPPLWHQDITSSDGAQFLTCATLRLCRYIGIQEKDFEWLTEQLVSLANKYCQGRIVSALEGGYRIQGGVVSAFARSVAAHVRALSSRSLAEWNWADVKAEQQREKQRKVMSMLALATFSICRYSTDQLVFCHRDPAGGNTDNVSSRSMLIYCMRQPSLLCACSTTI